MGRWRMAGWVMAALMLSAATPAATPQASPEFVPCPRADVPRPDHAPPPADAPRHGTGDRTIGGAGLDTDGLAVPPGAPTPPDTISATSWLVADLDSGEVLGACGAHEYGPPASTIKLLLTLTLIDELDPEETATIVREDLDIVPGSSAVGLVEDGEYTVETLWLGLLLNSGNEAANTLARLGGHERGVAGTVAAMNAEAARLGARQTTVMNPHGLDAEGQLTSAYDLALIARPLFERDDFLRYIATERADIPAQPDHGAAGFEIQNQNRLLYYYEGAVGGKTGYTDVARQTYVGVAQRDGRRLVVTLLGAEPQPMPSWQQGAALLDWGFSLPPGASVGRLVEPGSWEPSPSPQPAGSAALVPARPQAVPLPSTSTAWAEWPVTAWLGVGLAGFGVLLLVAVMAQRLGRGRRGT